MANIKAWITVNGRHIPIMEGENKAQALANHFKNLKKEHRSKLEKKYNDGQKKVDELRKNLQKAKDENNAPMTRFYEKKLQDASEEQFKTTNRIADSYRTIKGVNTMGIKKYNDLTKKIDEVQNDKSLSVSERASKSQKLFDERAKLGRYGDTSKYKLKEDNPKIETAEKIKKYKLKEDTPKQETTEKRKITGVKKGLSEKEIRKLYAKEDYTDVINTLPRKERNELKSAYRDMDYYSPRSSEYRETKKYVDKMEAKAANLYSGSKTYKKIESTQVQRNAYREYIKQHPSSKMKFTTFKSKYYKD